MSCTRPLAGDGNVLSEIPVGKSNNRPLKIIERMGIACHIMQYGDKIVI
jgi:hypothetical protein